MQTSTSAIADPTAETEGFSRRYVPESMRVQVTARQILTQSDWDAAASLGSLKLGDWIVESAGRRRIVDGDVFHGLYKKAATTASRAGRYRLPSFLICVFFFFVSLPLMYDVVGRVWRLFTS